jgi:hypothetical protein
MLKLVLSLELSFELSPDFVGGEGGQHFFFMQRLSHLLPRLFHMPCPDMPDLDFLRHAHNAYWFFLVTQLHAFVETHDGFFEDVEERLVLILVEGVEIGDLGEEVAAFETEFGSEEDLFGVLVVVSRVVVFEGHARYNYYCICESNNLALLTPTPLRFERK